MASVRPASAAGPVKRHTAGLIGGKRKVLLVALCFQGLLLVLIGAFFLTAGPQEKEWASHKADGYLNAIVAGEQSFLKFAHLIDRDDDPVVVAKRREAEAIHRKSPLFRTLASVKSGEHYSADYDVRPLPDPVDTFDGANPVEQLRAAGVHAFQGETVNPSFRYISNSNNQSAKYPFIWLSKSPRVAYFPEFLSDDLCERLIAKANTSMQRSAVLPHNKGEQAVQEIRTSSQAWLSIYEGPGKELVERILDLTGFRAQDAEMLQILRYEIGQKYVAHHDYFDPKLYGKQSTLRAATVFLYLADVEEGGETWFPSADGKPVITGNYGSCLGGLKVKPKKRSAALFYDMKPSGVLDPTSIHGGCPVIKGEKWGATLWLRVPAIV